MEQKEYEEKLNAFEIEINDSELKFKIHGYLKIQEFFQMEFKYWESLEAELRSKNKGSFNYISTLRSYFISCVTRFNELNAQGINITESNLKSQWNNVTNTIGRFNEVLSLMKPLYSQTPLAKYITETYRRNSDEGQGAYKFISGQNFNANSIAEFKGAIDAYEYLNQNNIFEKRRKAEEESLNDILNKWANERDKFQVDSTDIKVKITDWISSQQSEQETWKTNSQANLDSIIQVRNEQFNNLNQTYKEDLILRAPAKYWKVRSEKYRARGYSWLMALIVSISVLATILIYLLYNLPEAFKKNIFTGEPEAIKGLLIFATFISIFVYLIRLCSKLTLSSFHIERDAEEKEQLTYVYLSLIREGGASKEEREIILQSIFSRVDTGLLSGDSAPTMPTITSIFNKP